VQSVLQGNLLGGIMKVQILIFLLIVLLISGCNLQGPEERVIQEMLKTFVASIAQGDEDLGRACMMDIDGFRTLNPDVSARTDAESFTETVMAELIHSYRDLKVHFRGRDVKFKRIIIGDPFYQYKGRQAFKDNEIIVESDGQEISIFIKGIVNINNQWRIVDLSGIDFLLE